MVWVVGGVLGLEVSPFRLSKSGQKGKFHVSKGGKELPDMWATLRLDGGVDMVYHFVCVCMYVGTSPGNQTYWWLREPEQMII